MSVALARKYRPKNFASVAVQSHVSNTLKGAIARGRVAHGYLLCGPRGTGKTTLARVLAMALNCERRPRSEAELGNTERGERAGGAADREQGTLAAGLAGAAGEPCGECTSCVRIWSGSASLDVVEIDAASNRGVDDARELRERAMYAPSGEGRYKVYIVDEAHMLTREAWNALLKVLEEPPPRVVFVFATTEPQKIAQAAAPVLSRLQRFDLKRIGPAEIRERLAAVLDAEGVPYAGEALAIIARAADGGLRDALSLTDQVLSLGATGEVTADRVREALGLVPEDEYIALLDVVAERRAGDVFAAVGRLADLGIDFGALLTGLADVLRAQLAIALGGEAPELSERAREALVERRERLAPGDLLRMLHALGELEPRFRKSAQQQLLLETLLVRFALLDRTVELEDVLRSLSGVGVGGGAGGADARPEAASGRGPAAGTSRAGAPAVAPSVTVKPTPAMLEDSRASAPATPAVARPQPRPEPPASSVGAAGSTPDLNVLVERWDAVTATVRAAGRGILAAALEHVYPVAVTGTGVVTVEVGDGASAPVVEAGQADILAALRATFAGVQRLVVRAVAAAEPPAARRVTAESVKTDRTATLRRKDPTLNAAIDALDLDLVE
jgi:DNA polymerase III subunit gamma/tau